MSSTKTGRDPLDQALASLPEDVAPERDLWPQIRAEIAKTPIVAPRPRAACSRRWFRLAAAVLLVLATSFVTYYVTRQSMQQQVAQTAPEAVPAPQVIGQPASFSFGSERLGAGYMNARAELDKRFQERIASLPPATRTKVEKQPCGPAPRGGRDLRDAGRESFGSAAAGSVDVHLPERAAVARERERAADRRLDEDRSMRVAVAVAATLLLAQSAGAEEVEKRAQADPRGEVVIVNVAGDVQVTGWDRNEVQVNADLSDGVAAAGLQDQRRAHHHRGRAAERPQLSRARPTWSCTCRATARCRSTP